MPTTAYIGLGSNMGDRTGACRRALELLSRAGRVTAGSSLYCTEPVGYREQEEFINAVAELETKLSPRDLLAVCQLGLSFFLTGMGQFLADGRKV